MKKIDAGQAITVIANLGVIAGHFFVALEVRQTRDAVLGATFLARSSAQEEWSKWVAESEFIVHAAIRWSEADLQTLSDEDQYRLMNALEGAFVKMDGIFYQYELGLLPDDYYSTTFDSLMKIWVPRWKESGYLDRNWVVPRPSFQAEIEKYLNDPLLIK